MRTELSPTKLSIIPKAPESGFTTRESEFLYQPSFTRTGQHNCAAWVDGAGIHI